MSLQISAWANCRRCIEEWKAGASNGQTMAEYARLAAGFTGRGVQVWCLRHDISVIHVAVAQGQPLTLDASGELPQRAPLRLSVPKKPRSADRAIEKAIAKMIRKHASKGKR